MQFIAEAQIPLDDVALITAADMAPIPMVNKILNTTAVNPMLPLLKCILSVKNPEFEVDAALLPTKNLKCQIPSI